MSNAFSATSGLAAVLAGLELMQQPVVKPQAIKPKAKSKAKAKAKDKVPKPKAKAKDTDPKPKPKAEDKVPMPKAKAEDKDPKPKPKAYMSKKNIHSRAYHAAAAKGKKDGFSKEECRELGRKAAQEAVKDLT